MTPLTPADPQTRSADLVAENVAALRGHFPEAFSEGKVDFDVLRQLLGGAVDEREEKYGLNWHGKRRARQLALTASTGTLRPCPGDGSGKDEATTRNVVIEGDVSVHGPKADVHYAKTSDSCTIFRHECQNSPQELSPNAVT